MAKISVICDRTSDGNDGWFQVEDAERGGGSLVHVEAPAGVTAGTVAVQMRIDSTTSEFEVYTVTLSAALDTDLREVSSGGQVRAVLTGYTGTGNVVVKMRHG